MKNYAPINENKDVVTKEYVDNATVASAEKLTSSAGSSTVPVYFEDGKPKVCAYTLGSMSKESASDYEKAAVIDEKFAAVKNDIALNRTTLGTQCKNLLNETEYLASIKTATNGTLSKSDNSITLTATSNDCYTAPFFANDNGYRIPVSPNTTYILSWESDNSNYGIIHVFMNGIIAKQQSANNSVTKYLKFITDIDATFITIRFSVKNSGDSITYSNIMLRYADITDDTYEPYKENINERLIKNKSDIAVNKTTLGTQCKNLLKLTLLTTTVSGITFTVNDDCSITLNGTATGTIWLQVGRTSGANFRKEKLIFTGNPSGTGSGNGLEAWYLNSTTGNKYVSIANGNILTESEYDSSGVIVYEFHIDQGRTYNNVTYYPMLRYADITDDTYEPYQPSLIDRCMLKDTAGINLGHAQGDSIMIDNLSSYTTLWVNVTGGVSGINFKTNLIVPVAYLAKSTSNSVQLAGGIPSSAYITSEGALAAKNMDGTITAKVSGNKLDLTISDGIIGTIEVISLM